ncbi:hypothetical protein, partial [Nocardia wallacei]|uniref:hypothetical protein n=1 Tax=Nocardia wallacei TaxID=480035 RepID=UPI003CC7F065
MVVAARDRGATKAELDVADQLGAQLVRLMRAIGRTKSQLAPHRPGGRARPADAGGLWQGHHGPPPPPQRAGQQAARERLDILNDVEGV